MDKARIHASTCFGLLLAAGRGARFRRSASGLTDTQLHNGKLLAPLPASGISVARTSATQLTRVLERVLAVIPENDEALQQDLRLAGCEILIHPQSDRGMGSSLAAGIRAIALNEQLPTTCVVALADMPWIHPTTIRDLCLLESDAPIVAPQYQGQRGHPVRFDASLFEQLSRLDGDTGARSLMRTHAVHLMPCSDVGTIRDIDTVAQLQDTDTPIDS